jgi:hypothetical protein
VQRPDAAIRRSARQFRQTEFGNTVLLKHNSIRAPTELDIEDAVTAALLRG